MDYEGLSDFEIEGEKRATAAATKRSPIPIGEHLRTRTQWTELDLSKPLLKVIDELGFAHPTPIQRDAIPPILAGRDVLGRAETGSGKTCAFLLPALERLLQSPHVRRRRLDAKTGEVHMGSGGAATKVLVLLPTRELAIQCHKTCNDLVKYCPITRCLITGGMSSKLQEAEMRVTPDVVIATPGRCLDLLLNSASIHMDLLDIVIFDEADRLVELGFRDSCLAVLEHCSRDRQVLLFSATLNTQCHGLAALTLKDPVRVPSEAIMQEAPKIAQTLKQSFYSINNEQSRLASLISILESETNNAPTKKIICFFNTKKQVHLLSLIIKYGSFTLPPHCELHGDMTQERRIESMKRFGIGEARLMLCTDVASRGLDLESIDLVVNAEIPSESVKYIHRIGRTGRRGMEGKAITIFHQQEERQILKGMVKAVTGKKIDFTSDRVDSKEITRVTSKIEECMEKVKGMLKLENTEQRLRMAEIKVIKDRNLVKYAEEIRRRPEKRWIVESNKDKKQKKTKMEAI